MLWVNLVIQITFFIGRKTAVFLEILVNCFSQSLCLSIIECTQTAHNLQILLIVKHWKISLKYVLIKFWKPIALKSGHYCTWQNVCKHPIKFWCNHTCIINANEKKVYNTVDIVQVAILGRMRCLVLLFKVECMWEWETAILHPLLFFLFFVCLHVCTCTHPEPPAFLSSHRYNHCCFIILPYSFSIEHGALCFSHDLVPL